MRSRPLIVVSLVIICLLALIAIVALSRLPAGSQLPVHWNAAGEADRFADAGYALFMPVVLAVGLSTLFRYSAAHRTATGSDERRCRAAR